MAKKSNDRKARDRAARAKAGGRVLNASQNRAVTSRSWYELKQTHERSGHNLARVAGLLAQHSDQLVLMKMADNGDRPRFDELHAQVQTLMVEIGVEYVAMWDAHKDRKGPCTTMHDLEIAVSMFERYERFDISLIEKFQPIVAEINTMYNKAMNELHDIQVQVANGTYDPDTKDGISTVAFKEVPAETAAEVQPA